MTLRKCASIAGIVFVALLAAGSSGCSGGGQGVTPPVQAATTASAITQAITVSAVPDTATVEAGTTTGFTAMVTGDGANEGVTWAVSCSAATCGSVSPSSTASGATTTYTPPAPPASDLSVTLKATSVVNATKSAIVAVSVPAIRVSVASTSANVQAGTKAQFTATVTNDAANKGLIWTVSCTAAPCGSVSLPTTASGAATTYSAPATPPPSPLTVTLTATSVSDGTKTASATVTVPVVTVSVTPSAATVKVGASAQFSATVGNDVASLGVTWTLTCSSPSCGSVSPAATASGAITTYTAPSTQLVGNLTVRLTATSVTEPAASASATITVTGITVSIAPSSASVPSGGTQQFTTTVDNDPNSAGVTWQVVAKLWCDGITVGRCNPPGEVGVIYLPCDGCGTFSSASTASGAPTTYTAPVHLTPPSQNGYFFCGSCGGSLFIVATSVTNTSVSARAGLTIAPISISISISPTQAKVALNAPQQFTATVTNDGTNSGVTWNLTQNGVACAPDCGTLTLASTASGVPTTYTTPSIAPALPGLAVMATSVKDPTKSATANVMLTNSNGNVACGAGSGNESLLKGQYAFLLEGAVAGSFTADGTGRIIAGEEDSTKFSFLIDATIDAATSSYAIGSDHRGCLALTVSGALTTYFRFALGSANTNGVATTGHIVEFDDTTGTGTRAAGRILLQDPASFAAGQFKGNYVLGLIGTDLLGARVVVAGTFPSDGVSSIATASLDLNDAGTITSQAALTNPGSFTCCSANGRGTLTLPFNGAWEASPFAFYMISSVEAFVLESGFGNYSGEAFGIPPGTAFSQSSLNGFSVLRETAQSASGPIVDIASASSNGTGAMTVNDNVNNSGTFATGSTVLNYVVASNGRVMTTGSNSPPVLYLYGQNQGFLVGTDPDVTFGIVEPQAAGPFSDASLSGAYMLGTENPSASTVPLESGAVTADGSGNATGTSDQSSSAGLAQNQPVSLTYSIAADGTGTFGIDTTAILISGNKLVFISNTSANPTITVVEK